MLRVSSSRRRQSALSLSSVHEALRDASHWRWLDRRAAPCLGSAVLFACAKAALIASSAVLAAGLAQIACSTADLASLQSKARAADGDKAKMAANAQPDNKSPTVRPGNGE